MTYDEYRLLKPPRLICLLYQFWVDGDPQKMKEGVLFVFSGSLPGTAVRAGIELGLWTS